jgi:hypothetical protein
MSSKIDPRALAAGIATAIVTVGLVGLALHYGSAEQRDALVGAIVAVGVLAAGALRSWLVARQPTPPMPRPLSSALRDAGRDVSGRDSLADSLDDDETPAFGSRSHRPPSPPRRRGGWSGLDAALAIVFVGVAAAVLATALSGCGASALIHHARASSAASVAVVGAHDVIVATCQRSIDACGDVACVDQVHATCATAGSARDLTSEAVGAYADAIEIADIAGGEDASVLATLAAAAALALTRWATVADALAPLGVELPSLFSTPAEAGPVQTGGAQ